MSYFGTGLPAVSIDAGGRLRVGQLTTLGDLKTLNADDTLLMENTVDAEAVPATATWGDNGCLLTVTGVGNFAIRRSRQLYPYFSGKVTQVEMTQENFHTQAGVIKRVGYFSSNAADPFNSDKDGFWLEDDGTTKRLIVSRAGTEVLNLPQDDWNGDDVSTYDWSKFTVILFDFLWLGGAALRVMVKTDESFKTLHTYCHAGNGSNTMTKSPNHSVRWECRYNGNVGSMRAICAQVSTEGSVDNAGKRRVAKTGYAGLTTGAAGSAYPLVAIRKKAGFLDRGVKLLSFAGFVRSANDYAEFQIHLNPAFSADLTWSDITGTGVQQGLGDGTKTITSSGSIIAAIPLGTGVTAPLNLLSDDFLSWLGVSLLGASDVLALSVTPIVDAVTANGILPFKEY